MPNQKEFEPNDFPIEAENEKFKTQKGEEIGSAVSPSIAELFADRLNEHADREEEDRWSA